MEEASRWIVFGGLGGLAALLSLSNWLSLIVTIRTRKPTSLVFPFVCGPVGVAACWFGPSAVRWWFWVPLAADFTLWVVVGSTVAWVARWIRQGDRNAAPGAAADHDGAGDFPNK